MLGASLFVVGAVNAIQAPTNTHDPIQGAICAHTEAKVAAESKVEASKEAKAEQGYNGPIVPEDYDYAVHSYNLDAPFTDQDCYQKQVDIYSD